MRDEKQKKGRKHSKLRALREFKAILRSNSPKKDDFLSPIRRGEIKPITEPTYTDQVIQRIDRSRTNSPEKEGMKQGSPILNQFETIKVDSSINRDFLPRRQTNQYDEDYFVFNSPDIRNRQEEFQQRIVLEDLKEDSLFQSPITKKGEESEFMSQPIIEKQSSSSKKQRLQPKDLSIFQSGTPKKQERSPFESTRFQTTQAPPSTSQPDIKFQSRIGQQSEEKKREVERKLEILNQYKTIQPQMESKEVFLKILACLNQIELAKEKLIAKAYLNFLEIFTKFDLKNKGEVGREELYSGLQALKAQNFQWKEID